MTRKCQERAMALKLVSIYVLWNTSNLFMCSGTILRHIIKSICVPWSASETYISNLFSHPRVLPRQIYQVYLCTLCTLDNQSFVTYIKEKTERMKGSILKLKGSVVFLGKLKKQGAIAMNRGFQRKQHQGG